MGESLEGLKGVRVSAEYLPKQHPRLPPELPTRYPEVSLATGSSSHDLPYLRPSTWRGPCAGVAGVAASGSRFHPPTIPSRGRSVQVTASRLEASLGRGRFSFSGVGGAPLSPPPQIRLRARRPGGHYQLTLRGATTSPTCRKASSQQRRGRGPATRLSAEENTHRCFSTPL